MTPTELLLIFLVLFLAGIGIVFAFFVGRYIGRSRENAVWKDQVPHIRADAIAKSKSVVGGQFSEQLAPFLPRFPAKVEDVMFLGKPVDFVSFDSDERGNILGIRFIEVKSGKAQLSAKQKQIRDVIDSSKVSFEEYRVDGRITDSKSL